MCGTQMKTLPIPGAKNTELRLAQPDRLSSIASNTGARSPGDELITPKTSEITASRTFRQAWDKALSIGNHALVDVAIERGMDGMSDGLLKWQIQAASPSIRDQPKTINQNLSLMSPEQREEEAGRILLRIAVLGIPLTTIDGEAIDISDIEAEVDPAAMPKKP